MLDEIENRERTNAAARRLVEAEFALAEYFPLADTAGKQWPLSVFPNEHRQVAPFMAYLRALRAWQILHAENSQQPHIADGFRVMADQCTRLLAMMHHEPRLATAGAPHLMGTVDP